MKQFINSSYIKTLFFQTKAWMEKKLNGLAEKALTTLPEEKLPWGKIALVAAVVSVVFMVITLFFSPLLYSIEQRYFKYFNVPLTSFNLTLSRASLALLLSLLITLFAPCCIYVLNKLPSYTDKKNLNLFSKINLLYILWILVTTLVSFCWEPLALLVYFFQFLSSFVTTCLIPKSIYSTHNPARYNFFKLWLYFVCLTFLPLFFSLAFCIEIFGVDCFKVGDPFFSNLIVREIFSCFQIALLVIAILHYRSPNSTSKWLLLSVPSLILFGFACYFLIKPALLSDTTFVLSRFDQYALSYQRQSSRTHSEAQYQLVLDFKTPNSSYGSLVGQRPVVIPFYDNQAYYVFPCKYKENIMKCFPEGKARIPIIIPRSEVIRIRPYPN
ncbi:MAG: hypothetical protein WDW20_06405, partial [Neisseriaceae bacterium]